MPWSKKLALFYISRDSILVNCSQQVPSLRAIYTFFKDPVPQIWTP